MSGYESYFTDSSIIKYLCRYRASLAKKRNRKHLVYNLGGERQQLPIEITQVPEEEKKLFSLFPSRKHWKKLTEKQRVKNGVALNTLKKTEKILWITVSWYRRNQPDADFLAKQRDFFEEVRSFAYGQCDIPPPTIKPILKDAREKTCRPIAKYPLAARIAIAQANKYLTRCFDMVFQETSYAFRCPTTKSFERNAIKNHHSAVEQIIHLRRSRAVDLWVAESDIAKFFDTISHSILKVLIQKYKKKIDKLRKNPVDNRAIDLLHSYLKSYSFSKSVIVKNDDMHHFSDNGYKGFRYEWVEQKLVDNKYYKQPKRAILGVPQGGALSGLIANIYLTKADEVMSKCDDKLLYVRYCDDMIIIHKNKKKATEYMKSYNEVLRKLKLVAHIPVAVQTYGREHWKQKSKSPYKWGPHGIIPWVGFVGYEVNITGDVRVRRSSLRKEMKKQYDVVQEALRAVRRKPRASKMKIQESVMNRLIQMSVGKVKLRNYSESPGELCWLNGFRMLNDNEYTRIQMRRLDRCRNRLVSRMLRELNVLDLPVQEKPSRRRRARIYYGKPFSYYYHAIEKPPVAK